MSGEDRVSDFMGQDTVENSLSGALNAHLPSKGSTMVKHETRCSPRTQMTPNLSSDGTGLWPLR